MVFYKSYEFQIIGKGPMTVTVLANNSQQAFERLNDGAWAKLVVDEDQITITRIADNSKETERK